MNTHHDLPESPESEDLAEASAAMAQAIEDAEDLDTCDRCGAPSAALRLQKDAYTFLCDACDRQPEAPIPAFAVDIIGLDGEPLRIGTYPTPEAAYDALRSYSVGTKFEVIDLHAEPKPEPRRRLLLNSAEQFLLHTILRTYLRTAPNDASTRELRAFAAVTIENLS